MNIFKQNIIVGLVSLSIIHTCQANWLSKIGENVASNAGLETCKYVKSSLIEFVKLAVTHSTKIAKDHPKVVGAITYGTTAAITQSGVIMAVGPVVGAGYICYRLYQRVKFKSAEIDLKKQEVENARKMYAILERKIRIKEESAKIMQALMQQNAKIRNILLISSVATAASLSIGYVGYKFYKTRKQEHDIYTAKLTLLEAIASNEHNKIGQFRLPHGCTQAANALLVLPGGHHALDEIVSSLYYPSATTQEN
jgi:hypothetical protein